jgi:restriction system protein
MPIPDYQTIMLPLLQFCDQAQSEISTRAAVDGLAKQFKLSDAELREMLPSGTQPTFSNRVGWAATYMKKAGLLTPTRRGYYRVTDQGQKFLKTNPARIDAKVLRQFPEFVDFTKLKGTRKSQTKDQPAEIELDSDSTPSEALEDAYQNLRAQLASDILDSLKKVDPTHFERVVVELIVKMGYGGSRADAGKAIGRSGDEGIDGIIKEDKLGLDTIYIQAKRRESATVTRPDLQQFAGALQGQGAHKGIYITTSRFTQEAKDYAQRLGSKIVLIDGEQLAELMIDHDVGVTTVSTYVLKRIDSDYFLEDI